MRVAARLLFVLSATAILALTQGCKRRTSSSPPPLATGALIGKVEVRPGELRLLTGELADAEPNDRAWRLDVAGRLDAVGCVVHGVVGESGDALDLHAFAVDRAGWLTGRVVSVTGGVDCAIFVLPQGRFPAKGYGLGSLAASVPVAAGDIALLSCGAPEPRGYAVEVRATETTAAAARELDAWAMDAWLQLSLSMSQVVAGEVTVLADDAMAVDAAATRWGVARLRSGGRAHLLGIPANHPARVTSMALANLLTDLRGEPGVLALAPNSVTTACARMPRPDDPLFPQQWNLDMLRVPEAWSTSTGVASTVIAFLDSGVARTHPDLSPRLATYGWNFVENNANVDEPEPRHGTGMVGAAAAATNNRVMLAGIDWAARALPVRVTRWDGKGSWTGTAFDLAQGILFAAGLPNSSPRILNAAERANVINISLSLGSDDPVVADAVAQAIAQRVIIVAAVGNGGVAAPRYPAAYADVIGVGAVQRDGRRWPASNTGTMVDVVAPGEQVLSTQRIEIKGPFDTTALFNGTSIAAAQVSGIVGLMRAANPLITPRCALTVLRRTAHDLGVAGVDPDFGAGLVDAGAAVLAATGLDLETEAVTFLSPERLSTTVRIESCLTGIDALSIDAGWPSWVEPTLSGTTVPATLTLTIVPGKLTPPDRAATLTIRSSVGVRTLQVLLDPAFVWGEVTTVVLMDPSGVERLRGRSRASRFRLEGLAFGDYQLFAGIDNDGDGRLDSPGDFKSSVVALKVTASLSEAPVLIVR